MRGTRFVVLTGWLLSSALSSAACSSSPEPEPDADAGEQTPADRDAGADASDGHGGTLGTRDGSADARRPDADDDDAGASGPDAGPLRGRSSGCGKAHEGTGKYAAMGTQANDVNRVYYLYTPANYDATRAYPVIFRFHGHGGDGQSGGLEIEQQTNDGALVLSPTGLLESDGKTPSWASRNQASDVALFDRLLGWVADTYCVDLDRVYTYGFSAGGGMAQLLACIRGDRVRATGTIEAVDRLKNARCTGEAAAYLWHDKNDEAVTLAEAQSARDHVLAQNGCAKQTDPAGDNCVAYRDCAEGEPVTWCVTADPKATAHSPRGAIAAKPIWKFFTDLPAVR